MDREALEAVLGELLEMERSSHPDKRETGRLRRVVEAILEPDADVMDQRPTREGGRSPWRECVHENCRPVWTGGPLQPTWPCRR